MIYDVTSTDGVSEKTNQIIFQTPSKSAALSCAETFMELAGISTHVWKGLWMYAGFYTEDYFDIREE